MTERRTRSATPTKARSAPSPAWDDDIERLFESWLRRVAAAEAGHRRESDLMRRGSLMLGIPVVVLTTIAGTSVFASIQRGDVPTSVRVFIGTISILAAVLSSLQTFLRFGMRSEGHRIAAFRYETLRREMIQILALPRSARPEPITELDHVRLSLDRYAKESPMIDERRWAKLEHEFHLSKVPPDPQWGEHKIRIPEPSSDD